MSNTAETLIIKVMCEEGGVMPTRGRPEDVGLDLTARSVRRDTRHDDISMFVVDLGVRVEAPASYYVELVPRSSLAWSGFVMPNSVGVIDPEYRGILLMPLIHLGDPERAEERARALVGRRIAQLVVRRHEHAEVQQVSLEDLSVTARGEGRFGSSGR